MTAIAPHELAAITGRSARHERRLAEQGTYGAIERTASGRNARAIRIHIENLPAEIREKLFAERPHLAPRLASETSPTQPAAARAPFPFAKATKAQRDRAVARRAAVVAYEVFLADWADRPGITRAKLRWVERYALDHPELRRLSVDSVERWVRRYRAYDLDGLVDGNNGAGRRGKCKIPRAALNFFLARYLDKDAPPTIARAIEDTRLAANEYGWRLPKADDPFYRYVERHVPQAVKLARRESVDAPGKFLPYIQRAMDVPYRTLQSDHHIADVFVNCEGLVCGAAGCRSGHRPWFTPMFDVGSRKIISYRIGLDVPNSQRILEALQLAVAAEGLPERFYCDNGKDFKKAAEWKGLAQDDEQFLGSRFRTLGLDVVFARPYNAQAKAIERFFGTLVSRRWKGTEGYTGRLGHRSERTAHLCKNPHLLSTFTEFCQLLDAAIVFYNTTPHRGEGMNGRSPAEAFAEGRIPRRDPDAFAFRLVFWRTETRVLDRNGVKVSNLVYTPVDPSGEILARYLRERVRVLVNPQDVSQAILCNLDEQFLCEARVHELATHDTRDAITQEAMDRVGQVRKALKARLHAGDDAARLQLRRFKQSYATMMAREANRRREEEQRLVASGTNAATVVLPRYSRIARDLDAARTTADPLAGVSATDREAASQLPRPSDEQLDAMLRDLRTPGLRLITSTTPLSAEPESDEIEALRIEADIRRKESFELCLVRGCEERRTRVVDESELCGAHWLEAYGSELDPAALNAVRKAIEEER